MVDAFSSILKLSFEVVSFKIAYLSGYNLYKILVAHEVFVCYFLVSLQGLDYPRMRLLSEWELVDPVAEIVVGSVQVASQMSVASKDWDRFAWIQDTKTYLVYCTVAYHVSILIYNGGEPIIQFSNLESFW